MCALLHITIVAALSAATATVQADKPNDRDDALRILQGTSPTPKIDAARIDEVVEWLARIRKAHPEVREIHAMGRHELGSAILFFAPDAKQRLARAKRKIAANQAAALDGSSGIPALDRVIRTLGATLHPFMSVRDPEFWVARFPKDYDVPAVCRSFAAVPGVADAGPNVLVGDGNQVFAKFRGTKLLLVFKKGWGDCPAGCIHNHYFYFEVDRKAGKFVKRGEHKKDFKTPAFHLWGIPARFAASVFADFDALLRATENKDWWVVLHAVEVTGWMLTGRKSPMYGEDLGRNRPRWDRIRAGVDTRPRDAYWVLVHALEHADPDVRARALWHLRNVTKLSYGGDAAGIRAWQKWLATKKFNR